MSELGNVSDTRCKANMIRSITRVVCRNNCKYWGYLKEKKWSKKQKKWVDKRGCRLGY